MAIRIRKMTTGWGTMFPTFSTPSRNLCIAVFGAAFAVDIAAFLSAGPHGGVTPNGAILVAFELSPLLQGVMSAESKALAACPEIGGNLFTLTPC
jgi:hypothetical protein